MNGEILIKCESALETLSEFLKNHRSIFDGCMVDFITKDIFDKVLKIDLEKCESKCVIGEMTSSDIGISTADLAQSSTSDIPEYLFLTSNKCKGMAANNLSGASSHFDVSIGGRLYRYQLEGHVQRRAGKNICSVHFKDGYYELFNSHMTSVKRDHFVSSSRVSSILMFRLIARAQKQSGAPVKKAFLKRKANEVEQDHFDFATQEHAVPRKNKKIKVLHSATMRVPPTPWLPATGSGRFELTSDQQKILASPSQWYDDVIINSYARMCKTYVRGTFRYQDSCIGSHWLGFTSVDEKFIQIANIRNSHWIILSNYLTYSREPHTVEIYDSAMAETSFLTATELNGEVAKLVLQLRPNTSCVRYIKTQRQNNGNDCGPYVLGFLWSLSRGVHPANFEYNLNPSSIRKNVNYVLSTDNFIPPTQTSPKSIPKTVLKEFHLNERDGKFCVPA